MAVTAGVGEMDETEIRDVLTRNKAGVLTLVDGDKPYGVPVEHYFDGRSIYFVTSHKDGQRKIHCMKNNANACYIIYDSRRDNPKLVREGIPCRSVIIEGQIRLVDVKEVNSKESGKVEVQILRLDVGEIGNWKCLNKICDWTEQWFEKYPHLVSGN
jgi:nitroimidazol reductase NimA-like FMN-containing flavoprotein (pyridoxamine 5'-phosphate oxidase superfamily)